MGLERFSSYPAVEEELEWLSNKDAFPSVESCFADIPQLVSNHQNSPISVLENTNASSNNGSGSALVVATNIPLQPQRSSRGRKRKAHYDESSASSSSVLPPDLTSGCGVVRRRCLHCQVDKTPQWRAGPMGPKTLCNACGVRYKSGRLLPEYRPANSPTFSRALHSNSHRKVVAMRNEKQVTSGGDL